jgi:putative ABC transport system permease protein
MLKVAVNNLLQRRLRAALTMLGVAVAVQLFLTMSSINISFELDLENQLTAMAGKVYVQRPTSEEAEAEEFPSPSSSIEQDVANQLLMMDGVNREASSAMLYVPLTTTPAPGLPPSKLALGIESGHENAFLGGIEVEFGTGVLEFPNAVILGQAAADLYRVEGQPPVGPGDTIKVLDQELEVVGVLGKSPNLYRGMVLMDLNTAQDIFNRRGNVSAVILSAESIDDLAQMQTTIGIEYPDLKASDQADIVAEFRARLESVEGFFAMINGTVVAVVFMFVSIVMFVAVMERRRDIGVLRAIGARRIAIFQMIASESLILSLGGAILAWPIWFVIGEYFIGEFSSSPEVIFSGWLEMGVLVIVVGIGASLVPAWRAVRIDPLEALRYE